jgi:long-chain acyl-CoA synthetase
MRLEHLLERSVALHRDRPAVDDGRRRVSYAELGAEVKALAAGLSRLGLGPGDRAAILAKNRIEYLTFCFAVAELGAVVVPLNHRLHPRELAYILRDSGARLLLAEPAFAAGVDEVSLDLPFLQHKVALDEALAGWFPFARLLEPGASKVPAVADDVAVQMYTSGTTGQPKGSLLTHRNLLAMTASWLIEMPLSSQDRFLQVTPLFHIGGLLMVLSNLGSGSELVLLPEFDPGRAAQALAERRITHALFVPAMLRWLLSDGGVSAGRFPDLGLIVYGASPIGPALLERAMGVFDCDFLQGYGLTETSGVLTTLRPDAHRSALGAVNPSRLASAGRPVLCARVRIVDVDDRPLAAGQIGEIVAQGENISPGYWNLPDASTEALRGGWFHTGDVGFADEQGYITIVDRAKDMIIVGGENVYPREIEAAIESHPEVAEAAVIGVPHPVWGEEVLAVVVGRGALPSDRELIQYCRARLARFKCPTRVEFRAALPRNAAGKLLKKALREPYWQGLERRV